MPADLDRLESIAASLEEQHQPRTACAIRAAVEELRELREDVAALRAQRKALAGLQADREKLRARAHAAERERDELRATIERLPVYATDFHRHRKLHEVMAKTAPAPAPESGRDRPGGTKP